MAKSQKAAEGAAALAASAKPKPAPKKTTAAAGDPDLTGAPETGAPADKPKDEEAGKPPVIEGNLQVVEKNVTPGASGAIAVMPKDFKIAESERDIRELLADRVQVNEKGNGLIISEELPLEEWLPVFDHFQTLQACAGFFIGDLINFAALKYGERYVWAMQKTGRALSTLKSYTGTSRAITADVRVPELGFSIHRVIAHVEDKKEQAKLLKVALKGADGKSKEPMSVAEFAKYVKEVAPVPKKPKKEGAKSPGRKKSNGTSAPVTVRELLPKEVKGLEKFYDHLAKMNDIMETDFGGALKLRDAVLQAGYKVKHDFVTSFQQWDVYYNEVLKKEGYPNH